MFAVIVKNKVEYYGNNFNEASSIFGNAAVAKDASLHVVDSLDAAAALAKKDEKLFNFFDNELDLKAFSDKMYENAESIVGKVRTYGKDTVKAFADGLTTLGKTIHDVVETEEKGK